MLAHPIGGFQHVGRRSVVLRIGDEDGPRVNPGAGYPVIREGGRDDPAADDFADRVHGVARTGRHLAKHGERVHEAVQLFHLAADIGEHTLAARARHRGGDR